MTELFYRTINMADRTNHMSDHCYAAHLMAGHCSVTHQMADHCSVTHQMAGHCSVTHQMADHCYSAKQKEDVCYGRKCHRRERPVSDTGCRSHEAGDKELRTHQIVVTGQVTDIGCWTHEVADTRHDTHQVADTRRDTGHGTPQAADTRRDTGHDTPQAADTRRDTGHDTPQAADTRRDTGHGTPQAADTRRDTGHDTPQAADSRHGIQVTDSVRGTNLVDGENAEAVPLIPLSASIITGTVIKTENSDFPAELPPFIKGEPLEIQGINSTILKTECYDERMGQPFNAANSIADFMPEITAIKSEVPWDDFGLAPIKAEPTGELDMPDVDVFYATDTSWEFSSVGKICRMQVAEGETLDVVESNMDELAEALGGGDTVDVQTLSRSISTGQTGFAKEIVNTPFDDGEASNMPSGVDTETDDMPVGNKETDDMPVGNKETDNMPFGNMPAGNKETDDMTVGNKETDDMPDGNKETDDMPVGNKKTADMPIGNRKTANVSLGDIHVETEIMPLDKTETSNMPFGNPKTGNVHVPNDGIKTVNFPVNAQKWVSIPVTCAGANTGEVWYRGPLYQPLLRLERLSDVVTINTDVWSKVEDGHSWRVIREQVRRTLRPRNPKPKVNGTRILCMDRDISEDVRTILSVLDSDLEDWQTGEEEDKTYGGGNSRQRMKTTNKPHRNPAWCNVCGKRCRDRHAKEIHMLVHTGKRPKVCKICGKSYKQAGPLIDHMVKHTGERPWACKFCGRRFITNQTLKRHALIHTDERPYKCDICGKRFRQWGGLNLHKSTHSVERPYPCEICGKMYKTIRDVQTHLIVHDDVRAWECDICHMKFKRKHGLDEHKRTHTGVKPHMCEICGMSFYRANSLRTHKTVHSDERPYSCHICNATFRRIDSLKTHIVHHRGERKPCKVCSKQVQVTYMMQHMRTHTGPKIHPCHICQKMFRRIGSVRQHLEQMHYKTDRKRRLKAAAASSQNEDKD